MNINDLRKHPGLQARVTKQLARLDRYDYRLEDLETNHARELQHINTERNEYLLTVAEFMGLDLTPAQLRERIKNKEGQIDDLDVATFLEHHGIKEAGVDAE